MTLISISSSRHFASSSPRLRDPSPSSPAPFARLATRPPLETFSRLATSQGRMPYFAPVLAAYSRSRRATSSMRIASPWRVKARHAAMATPMSVI